MLALPYPVVLASASPRRRELLGQLAGEFEVLPADLDEDALTHEVPWQTARDLARAKAAAIYALRPNSLVIAGDTVVAIPVIGNGYEQLSKPIDEADARRMLAKLAGIQHLVITGVCLRWPEGERFFEVTSGVTFRPLSESVIRDYVAAGESMDKAGAYAAQGRGASIISGIEGSLTNVIGLPMERLEQELAALCAVTTP